MQNRANYLTWAFKEKHRGKGTPPGFKRNLAADYPPEKFYSECVYFQYESSDVVVGDSGIRMFAKRFGIIPRSECIRLISATALSDRCAFESVIGSYPHRFYLDIDAKRYDAHGTVLIPGDVWVRLLDLPDLINSIVAEILTTKLGQGWSIDDIKEGLIWYCSSKPEIKYSWHFIASMFSCHNNFECQVMCSLILERLPGEFRTFIDVRMYKSLQQFRLRWCQKRGSNRFKIPGIVSGSVPPEIDEDLFFDSLVSYVPSYVTPIPGLLIAPILWNPRPKNRHIPVRTEVAEIPASVAGDIFRFFEAERPQLRGVYAPAPKLEGDLLRLDRIKSAKGAFCPACDRDHGEDYTGDNGYLRCTFPIPYAPGALTRISFGCFRSKRLVPVGYYNLILGPQTIAPAPDPEPEKKELKENPETPIHPARILLERKLPDLFAALIVADSSPNVIRFTVKEPFECPKCNMTHDPTGSPSLHISGPFGAVTFDCGLPSDNPRSYFIGSLRFNPRRVFIPADADEVCETRYVPDLGTYFSRSTTLAVRSPMNTGKTEAFIRFCLQSIRGATSPNHAVPLSAEECSQLGEILVYSTRELYAHGVSGTISKLIPDFKCYKSLKPYDVLRTKHLMISLESQHHLLRPKDVVVPFSHRWAVFCDEFTALLAQFTSSTIIDLKETARSFEYIIRMARYVYVADANLGKLERDILKLLRPDLVVVHNSIVLPKREAKEIKTEVAFFDSVCVASLKENRKLFLVINHREKANYLRDLLIKGGLSPDAVLVYSSETPPETREALRDVNSVGPDDSSCRDPYSNDYGRE